MILVILRFFLVLLVVLGVLGSGSAQAGIVGQYSGIHVTGLNEKKLCSIGIEALGKPTLVYEVSSKMEDCSSTIWVSSEPVDRILPADQVEFDVNQGPVWRGGRDSKSIKFFLKSGQLESIWIAEKFGNYHTQIRCEHLKRLGRF
jgi:hypothetical protein